MKAALFTIHVELKEGRTLKMGHRSIVDALDDPGLRGLFDDELVKTCSLHSGSRRLTATPIDTWDRLRQQLTSNSSTLLQRYEP